MRRLRNTKIIATLGPASATPDDLRALFEAGADVFRMNFSHGDVASHRQRYQMIRDLEEKIGRPIGVIGDLQGPKIRIGKFADSAVKLKSGQEFRFDLDPTPGDRDRVCLPHEAIFGAAEIGMELLLDDGRIRLRVDQIAPDFIITSVVEGGPISDAKGVNVPGVALPLKPLTDKDSADLDVALDLGVDWVALSFVQRAKDVAEVRARVDGRAGLIAKIEKPSAIDDLDGILAQSDGIMVARGDLGVELPIESVPGLQKKLVRAARAAGKPVVVATQMLESMVHAAMPTRAEVSDVANAVYDGADAVMLSAESAVGEHPVEAVGMMDRIAIRVESDPLYRTIIDADKPEPEATSADAITAAAAQTAHTLGASVIASFSATGSTSLRASRERPTVPILGLTPRLETARRLALAWGVHNVLTDEADRFAVMVDMAVEIALRDGFAKIDDRLVIVAGIPFGTPGATNVLRVAQAQDPNSKP
jgi:pyruvate kinase